MNKNPNENSCEFDDIEIDIFQYKNYNQVVQNDNTAHTIKDEFICGSFKDCIRICRLSNTMQKYRKFVNICSTDENIPNYFDVYNALNDFLHLLLQHDDEFEFIFNNVGGYCDASSCQIFARHHRDRYKLQNNVDRCKLYHVQLGNANIHEITIANIQIMDKIHCYFTHCFDIGNRFNHQQKLALESKQFDPGTKALQTKRKLTKLKKVMSTKHKSRPNHRMLNRTSVKEKFIMHTDTCTDNKEEKKIDYKPYSYGMIYVYSDSARKNNNNYIGRAFKKYSSLKQELCENIYSAISINQFNVEMHKANKHISSEYFKIVYSKSYNIPSTYFSISHLLSLMIYCNYDVLQYEFSKTYRADMQHQTKQSLLTRHENFCHFAQYLTESIHLFGTRINDGQIQTFYFGIQEMLSFDTFEDVYFHCPLSTSSSFPVAVNFSGFSGLVLQLSGKCCKYFSVSWLSDYGNESEYLFHDTQYPLKIENIFMIKYETDAEMLFKACKYLTTLDNNNISVNEQKRMQHVIQYVSRVMLQDSSSFSNDYYVTLIRYYLASLKSISWSILLHNLETTKELPEAFRLFTEIHDINLYIGEICSKHQNENYEILSKTLDKIIVYFQTNFMVTRPKIKITLSGATTSSKQEVISIKMYSANTYYFQGINGERNFSDCLDLNPWQLWSKKIFIAYKPKFDELGMKFELHVGSASIKKCKLCNYHPRITFQPQPFISYDEAIRMSYITLYDEEVGNWRNARVFKKWDETKRIMITFSDSNVYQSSSKYSILKNFPVNYIKGTSN
eukprot:425427_1